MSERKHRKRPRADDDDDEGKNAPQECITGTCAPVSRYEKLGRLGQGTYGVVYKARDTWVPSNQNNTVVALKRCLGHHTASDGFPVTTLREMENLRTCRACPYIVSLLDIAVSTNAVFLVLEYCSHDLAEILDDHFEKQQQRHHHHHHGSSSSPFTEHACQTLLRQLLTALDFMHSRHILHRDVKMSNLLYHQGMLKLADLGLSRHWSAHDNDVILTQKVASLWYRAPEILCGCTRYTSAIDLWAAGCAWAELLKGKPLLPAKNEIEQIHQIHRQIGFPDDIVLSANNKSHGDDDDFPALQDNAVVTLKPIAAQRKFRLLEDFGFLSSAGCQLLTSLLQIRGRDRWTAEQALRSPYFGELGPLLTAPQMPRFRGQGLK